MNKAAYITMVMHNLELQQYLVDKGVVSLGAIYSIMLQIGEHDGVDFDSVTVDELKPLIDKYV